MNAEFYMSQYNGDNEPIKIEYKKNCTNPIDRVNELMNAVRRRSDLECYDYVRTERKIYYEAGFIGGGKLRVEIKIEEE